jgi:hypothetical protein
MPLLPAKQLFLFQDIIQGRKDTVRAIRVDSRHMFQRYCCTDQECNELLGSLPVGGSPGTPVGLGVSVGVRGMGVSVGVGLGVSVGVRGMGVSVGVGLGVSVGVRGTGVSIGVGGMGVG